MWLRKKLVSFLITLGDKQESYFSKIVMSTWVLKQKT